MRRRMARAAGYQAAGKRMSVREARSGGGDGGGGVAAVVAWWRRAVRAGGHARGWKGWPLVLAAALLLCLLLMLLQQTLLLASSWVGAHGGRGRQLAAAVLQPLLRAQQARLDHEGGVQAAAPASSRTRARIRSSRVVARTQNTQRAWMNPSAHNTIHNWPVLARRRRANELGDDGRRREARNELPEPERPKPELA